MGSRAVGFDGFNPFPELRDEACMVHGSMRKNTMHSLVDASIAEKLRGGFFICSSE